MTDQNKNTKKTEVAQKPRQQQKPASTDKKLSGPSIYIGPTLQGGRLARYTIFKDGGLPPHIAALTNEHRAIKRLIVPVGRLAEYEKRLRDPSSAESSLFNEAAKIFSKGGN